MDRPVTAPSPPCQRGEQNHLAKRAAAVNAKVGRPSRQTPQNLTVLTIISYSWISSALNSLRRSFLLTKMAHF